MLYVLIALSMLALGGVAGFMLKWLLEERPSVLHYYGIVSEEGGDYRATFPDFGNLQVEADSISSLKSASLKALEKKLSGWRYKVKVPLPSNPQMFELGDGDLGTLLTVVYLNGLPSPDLGESPWTTEDSIEDVFASKAKRASMVEELLGSKKNRYVRSNPHPVSGPSEAIDVELQTVWDKSPSIPAR